MHKRLILRKLSFTGIAIIFFFIETAVFPIVSFNSIYPNLLIMLTCITGFVCGKREGMYIGFVCGLLLDIFSNGVIGFSMLLFMYIGYINGLAAKLLYKEDVLFPIAMVAVTDFIYNFIFYILNFLLKNRLDFGYYFIRVIVPEIIFTVIATVIAYKFFLSLNKKLEKYERGSVNELD